MFSPCGISCASPVTSPKLPRGTFPSTLSITCVSPSFLSLSLSSSSSSFSHYSCSTWQTLRVTAGSGSVGGRGRREEGRCVFGHRGFLKGSEKTSVYGFSGGLGLGGFRLLSKEKRERGRGRETTGVRASLLGVGAPEALVIAVVALLVFGPKGLAEVARNLGKTLKTFQPTIRELQDVSREFRSTLEQEIGLDELREPYRPPRPPSPTPSSLSSPPPPSPTAASPSSPSSSPSSPSPLKTEGGEDTSKPSPKAYSAEDYARVTEEQTRTLVPEELRKASEAAAWGGVPPVKSNGQISTTNETKEIQSKEKSGEESKSQ